MRVAAIDIGSNSIHMVVAQVESDGRFSVLDRAKEMVRLGRGTWKKGRLSAAAIRAGVRTLAAFRTLAERQGVTRFKVVATSAVREAVNGGDFISAVRARTGLIVRVIPGREEARLVFLGVQHAIDLRGAPVLIVDAGGGSVELILTEDAKPLELHSLRLGVARLSEQFILHDPAAPKELARLEARLAEAFDPVLKRAVRCGVQRVIGTSGTMLNLIAMAGHQRGELPNGRLHNFVVAPDEIRKLKRTLCKADRDGRLHVKGIEPKRVDFIAAGACLADHVLTRLAAEEFIACTWALREGVVLDFIARHRKGIAESKQFTDPRRRSVARFARHLGESDEHGARVARLALRLFDELQPRHRLDTRAREWLEFAALLHDIGHHISHKDHHRHAYYLITNGELLGFRRDELEIIAQTARYHQKAAPKATDGEYGALSSSARKTVRALSAILRVADALDRSHYGVVRDLSVRARNGRLTVKLDTRGEDAALELWEARQRAALLAQVTGLDVRFRAGK